MPDELYIPSDPTPKPTAAQDISIPIEVIDIGDTSVPGTYATVWRRIYRRGGFSTPRGEPSARITWERVNLNPIPVTEAQGSARLSLIGSGKCKMPADLAVRNGVRPGDVIVVFQVDGNPYNSLANTRRVACFIVEARQYENGLTALSGPDLLGELQDSVSFEPIGDPTIIRTEITEGNPGQRIFTIRDSYDGTTTSVDRVKIWGASDGTPEDDDGGWKVAVGEEITIPLARSADEPSATQYHVSIIRGLEDTDGNDPTIWVDLETPITGITKLEGEQELVYVVSYRLETTSDADNLTVGDRIWMYTSSPDGLGGQHRHYTRIDRITQAPDADDTTARYYVWMAEAPVAPIPILDPTDQTGPNEIVATTYSEPTTEDIDQLFEAGTGDTWAVKRDSSCTVGTSYEPAGETVWESLLGIVETSGYQFKLVKDYERPDQPDRRTIRLMDASDPARLFRGTLAKVGTDNRKAADYGEIIAGPRVEDSQDIVTHVIPFGAGSGYNRFTIRDAQPLPILEEYFNRTGRKYTVQYANNYTYIRRDTEFDDTTRPAWRTKTWDHIRPTNEANATDRQAAANNLLRAGLDYLEKTREYNVAYEVVVHTFADPQPGDVLPVFEFVGVESFPIRFYNLIISEVHHEVQDDGIRRTRLVLVKNIVTKDDGAMMLARLATAVKRGNRSTNASTAGGTIQSYDRTVYRGQAVVATATGPLVVKSQDDSVRITAPAAPVVLSGTAVNTFGQLTARDRILAQSGLALTDEGGRQYTYTVEVINGRERLVYNTTPPTSGDTTEEGADEPDFVGNIYP